jgi:hypothetical protein
VPDERSGIDLPDWKTLAPAQQNALAWLLVRRLHAEQNRAVGKLLLALIGKATEQLWRRQSPLPRGKDF